MSADDKGPFPQIESGGHVRRGYTPAMLEELCRCAGLVPEQISYCSGYFSQRITTLLRVLSRIHPLLAWALTLPLRIIPPIFDPAFSRLIGWPSFSICLEAYKPRYPPGGAPMVEGPGR